MNWAGEKEKLLLIGKAHRPRGFPRGNLKDFPVHYESNASAWMTGDIWRRFLLQWDAELRAKGRHILYLVDNCPGHPDIQDQLTHIQVEYLD